MTKYVLAIDQGTTSSRCILFDKNANIKGVAQKEFTQYFPEDGWVEHNAKEIWATQFGMLNEVLAVAGVKPSAIDSIGITNQRETTVIWNKHTGEPIYNAIVWQDRRTSKYCDELKKTKHDEMILEKTGLVLDSYFSGTKVRWLLDNVKGARVEAEKGNLLFGTIDSWLIWKLTNGASHVTDYSNASRTMLFNIHTLEWDRDILELLNIPENILPKVQPSSSEFGVLDRELLGAEIKITGVAGDQQAATFGQACLKAGMAKNTYGTGCFMLLNVGKDSKINKEKILTTIAWGRKDSVTYALEGSVFVGGAIVQWLRDGLGIINKSSEIEALAGSVKDNGGVYLVPAFVGLGAPQWDAYARGTILGLTRGSTKANIARAALESIAFQSYDLLETMNKISSTNLQELRVDGGASNNNLLMQFQADLLQIPVVRPKITETTALGAAYLAGLYTKYWQSAEEITLLWQKDIIFEPKMKNDIREEYLATWHKALERSKEWLK